MNRLVLSRRTALFALAAGFAGGLRPAAVLAAPTAIRVAKDPGCGCCGAWIEIIEADGFAATIDLLDYDALQAHKIASGIPENLASCHTGHVEGYAIEGHVPPADIRRLLAARPDAVGLSVPGMPHGSPGMGPETEREAYIVYLIRRDGSAEVFTTYDAA
ncbi:DUF411 domain-containing protein [Frigidibacter sp.]|uniref:DUF411 domain-containing protein n=1 Tax=Frigidibacter sp. TaxID=2586418 RepID=UPI002734D48B|nr:DUF411 domain-containing protein [Frigidibacter sp.]MDP3342325.1 DUF411 domain-containing protein [Frigidibacter sp.]